MIGIVAMSENGVIGKAGTLPWKYPEDLKWFKTVTSGNVVIMGRKTFESLGKPLPNRVNIVLTRKDIKDNFVLGNSLEDSYYIFNTPEEMRNYFGLREIENAFVIGGKDIFDLMWDEISDWCVTRIPEIIEDGDVYFDISRLERDFYLKSTEQNKRTQIMFYRRHSSF
jgi:dihydrofolate reductase